MQEASLISGSGEKPFMLKADALQQGLLSARLSRQDVIVTQ
jgi:hypothetical protein